MNASVTVASIVTAINLLLALLTFFYNRKKENKAELQDVETKTVEKLKETEMRDTANTEFQIKTQMKLDQICTTTDEIRMDIKAMNSKIQDVDKRLFSAEKAIDNLNERVQNLENLK